MVEPTESEPLSELNRFIEALITIYNEIMEIRDGKADENDNVLKNAPHTAAVVISDEWNHKYAGQKQLIRFHGLVRTSFSLQSAGLMMPMVTGI